MKTRCAGRSGSLNNLQIVAIEFMKWSLIWMNQKTTWRGVDVVGSDGWTIKIRGDSIMPSWFTLSFSFSDKLVECSGLSEFSLAISFSWTGLLQAFPNPVNSYEFLMEKLPNETTSQKGIQKMTCSQFYGDVFHHFHYSSLLLPHYLLILQSLSVD